MHCKNPEYITMIENFINEYKEEHETVSPSVQNIADGVGLSTSCVSRYMNYMRENGIIEYSGQRNIKTRLDMKKQREEGYVRVPVLGRIACGVPKFADSNIEEYVQLPVSLFGRGEYYILRANGDSMIDAGIDDGDLVLIRHQNYADPGQIVVALMEDEATLKRYYPEPRRHRVRLHPENPEMRDIYVDNCIIQGIAINVVLKDLD